MQTHTHDVVILGSGLAGLRAALEIARRRNGKVNIALVSKVQLMRSHSVCAEGGTAAVLQEDEGDSRDLHAWDTIKGSDFLADQDVVDRFVALAPQEILQLEHWGLPWSRRPDGRIRQRDFGGHSFPRATMAADKTGFFEMHTLYDTLSRYPDCVTRYDEVYATAILMDGERFGGITVLDLARGEFFLLRGRALLIATGGAGVLYGFTTYSGTVTGDGQAMAYRAGLPLEDMEFMQFHPTGLVPSGILMTEACRGEGGYLRNSQGERFMQNYAPEKMELGPRDIVARAMMQEIAAGRGLTHAEGHQYLHLDLTHLGADTINQRLPLIREVAMKFIGVDPIHTPLPIRPVAHYSMGGIETDIHGATRAPGIWAAGEAACVSLHGANRLGTNSTAECLVWGGIAGGRIADYLDTYALHAHAPHVHSLDNDALAEEQRVFDDLARRSGGENPYSLRRELRLVMDQHVGVFRDHHNLSRGLDAVRSLKDRFRRIGVSDQGRVYNTNLINVLELENLLDLAEITTLAALAREESRGAHARTDFPLRNDGQWLQHSLVSRGPDGPELDYKPVTITRWQPVERTY